MKISEITNEVTTPSGADLVEMETAGGTSGKVKIRNLVGIVPVRTVASSTVLALTDVGGTVRMNSASATNFTVANNSSVAAPIGSVTNIRKVGSGNVTIVADSGVTVNNNTVLSGTYENATLHKIGTNEWDLIIGVGSGTGGGDTTAPTIVNAGTNGAGTQVTVQFSENMVSPTATGWTIEVNGSPVSITDVILSANIMYIFTLASPVTAGQTVTISYNGATGGATDESGNELANVTDMAVTNNVSGGSGFVNIAAWDNANLVNASDVWTVGSGGSSGYGNLAKSTSKLAASANGAIRMKKTASDAIDAVIGFNTSNATVGIGAMPYAAWMANDGRLYAREGGGPIDCGNIAVGEYPVIRRTGSAITLHISDGTTEGSALHTYAAYSGELTAVADFNKETGKMYDPEIEGGS